MHYLWPALWLVCQTAASPKVANEHTGITYEGTSADGVDQFQGIRFAEDTSGVNRFAPPKPYLPTPGSIVKATEPGESCPQASKGVVPPMLDVPYQSEDCLNLRIARPADPGLYQRPLPVMVYIYGGGAILGTAYDGFFNPTGLVQQSVENGQPVIYVAMNYRVGVFGFAAAEILREQKSENIGLRDQRLALEWIRDHIAAFGGDPSHVTLFGQSFGGISIGLQMVAWSGKQEKLFHKAIMASGAMSVDRRDDFTAANTLAVAKAVKCTDEHNVVDESALECLRKVPLATLLTSNLDVATTVKPGFGFAAFSAVIDGDMLPEQPLKLLTDGNFLRNIPLLATWVADDGSLDPSTKITTDSEVLHQFSSSISHFSPEIGEKILALYPESDFGDQARAYPGVSPQFFRASRIIRDIDPVCPLIAMAQQWRSRGTHDLYLAELNQTRLLPYWEAWGQPWGVSHLSDVAYFFNEEIPPPGDNSAAAFALSADYSGSFISFATRGNPVTKGKKTFQHWPRADHAVNIIGGLHGTGPAKASLFSESEAVRTELRRRQADALASSARDAAFDKEKLAERCTYLNSLRVYDHPTQFTVQG